MFKKSNDNFLKDDVVASVKMFHTDKGWMTSTSKGLVLAGAVAGAMVAPTVLNHVKANADSVPAASSAVKADANSAAKPATTSANSQLSAEQQAGLAKVGAKTETPAVASSAQPAQASSSAKQDAPKASTPAPKQTASQPAAKAPSASTPASQAKASTLVSSAVDNKQDAPVASNANDKSANEVKAPVASAVSSDKAKASQSVVDKSSAVKADASSEAKTDASAPVNATQLQANASVQQVANQSVKGEISANANDVAIPANQIANLTATQRQATLNSIQNSTFFSPEQKKAMSTLANENDAVSFAATPNGLKTSDGSRVITPAGVFNDTVNVPLDGNANNGVMELDNVGGTSGNGSGQADTQRPDGFDDSDNNNGAFPDKIAGNVHGNGSPLLDSGIKNSKGVSAKDAPQYVGNQIIYCVQPYGLGPGIGGASDAVTLTRGVAGDANQQREIAGILFYGYGGPGAKYTEMETHLALSWYAFEHDRAISQLHGWEVDHEGVTEQVAEQWLNYGHVKQLIQDANNWDQDNSWSFTVYSGHSDSFTPSGLAYVGEGPQLLLAAKFKQNTTVKVNTAAAAEKKINNGQNVGQGSQVKVSDNITLDFTNAIKGNTYTVTSKLIDKNTGNVLTTQTNQVTAEGNQTVKTVANATINTIGLQGHSIYWETTVDGNQLGGQKDFNKDGSDSTELISSPIKVSVTTTATDATTGNNVTNGTHNMDVGSNEVIDDDVKYTGLNPGETYTVTGVVYDKETKQPLTVDGKQITGSATFQAGSDGSGDVHVKFNIPDNIAQQGHQLVVEETIHDLNANGQIVATDTDLNNQGETVTTNKVDIHTTLTDQTDEQNKGSHTLEVGDGIKLVDTVTYTNLQPGQQYVMTGTLMDKETGKPVMDNGKKVTQSVAFTPTSPNGTVDVDFTLSNDIVLQGHDLVAYEDLTQQTPSGIKVVASHDNLYDQAETVHVPTPDFHTLATNGQGSHNVVAGPNSVIVDSVQYHNLIPGQKYTVSGTLFDKNTGKMVVGDDGKPVTSSVTFIPTTPNGTVNITFHFDGTKYAGHQLVAEEKLYDEHGTLIASYDDINDLAETVTMVKPTLTPQQGGVTPATPSPVTPVVPQAGSPAPVPATSAPKQAAPLVQKGSGKGQGQGLPDTGAGILGLALLAGAGMGIGYLVGKKKFA